MIDSIYIADSGLRAQQTALDVISNNIVNMQTPGFKKSAVSFSDVAYTNGILPATPTADSPASQLVGGGTSVASTYSVFNEGDIRATGNPLDLAIQGTGFFEVIGTNGQPAYTRAGQLKVDKDGYLATLKGDRLSANIQIPPDAIKITITPDGKVAATLPGSPQQAMLGQIQLARFIDADGLKPLGNGNYALSADSGQPIYGNPGSQDMGTVTQGSLEISNVDMNEEMTNLMLAQRAYQLSARVIQVSDQILDTINNLKR